MALNLDERYPGRANGKTLAYPQGSFKNRTSPNSQDGTYLEQDWANDWAAFFQSLIAEAGFTANGDVDTVGASQYFDALIETVRSTSLPIYATTPPSNVGPIIYVIDRQQILLWQTIGTYTGYASAEVGDFRWGTSISPKPGTELLIGQTIDRTLTKYAALVAWADANGHMVASGSWTKGAFHFASLGGNSIRLPDLRDQFIRATGTDADTANARTLGTKQAPQFQSHTHLVNASSAATGGNGSGGYMPYESGRGGSQYIAAPSGGPETRPTNTALHPVIAL